MALAIQAAKQPGSLPEMLYGGREASRQLLGFGGVGERFPLECDVKGVDGAMTLGGHLGQGDFQPLGG